MSEKQSLQVAVKEAIDEMTKFKVEFNYNKIDTKHLVNAVEGLAFSNMGDSSKYGGYSKWQRDFKKLKRLIAQKVYQVVRES